MVLGGFRSFHVLVTTKSKVVLSQYKQCTAAASKPSKCDAQQGCTYKVAGKFREIAHL